MIALVLAAMASACSAGAVPSDFTDLLTGPTSAALSIPFDKYALTPSGLMRTQSESGTENGIDRPIIRTVSGRYLSRDFVFEVDVTIPADHGDIAYVGFGEGTSNRILDNEPSRAFLFRIHNLPRMPFYGIDLAVADPEGGVGLRGAYRDLRRVAQYQPGSAIRFRIEHRSGRITLSVPSQAEASATFELATFPNLFAGDKAHLFLSNSSRGTTFSNASLRAP